MASPIIQGLAAFGALTLAYGAFRLAKSLSVFVRPSHLSRYAHCSEGSWALVTGASDGIGRAFVDELLSKGFNVVLHGRNESKLSGIKADLQHSFPQRQTEILVVDANKIDTDFAYIVQKLRRLPGKLTLLVNNAGGIHSSRQYMTLEANPAQDIIDCANINALFPTLLTSALIPLLRENGPSLVLNCGSVAAIFAPPYISVYAASKGYLHALTTSLRTEIQAQGFSDKVEILTAVIGNTTSAGNTTHEAGSTITSRECARSCLARVGCGSDFVVPHIRHWLQVQMLSILPESTVKNAMIPILKKRFDAENDGAKKSS